MIKFHDKNHKFHNVFYTTFHGPVPEGKTIDHLNRDRTDNALQNLEPKTPSEQRVNQSRLFS